MGDNPTFGSLLGATALKGMAYPSVTSIAVGDKIAFLDGRDLGEKPGKAKDHYRGEVMEVDATKAKSVKVKLQKFDPVNGAKLSDTLTEEWWPAHRLAPYATVMAAFAAALASIERVRESEDDEDSDSE